jgi:hypothetical protein
MKSNAKLQSSNDIHTANTTPIDFGVIEPTIHMDRATGDEPVAR